MSLKEKVANLKKKSQVKQIEGINALLQLRDLIKNQPDNSVKMIQSIDKLEKSLPKEQNLRPIIKEIQKIKLDPQVKITLDSLKEVERILENISDSIANQTEPLDIEGLIRRLQDPKNAISVVLTDKERKKFYNALTSLPMFSAGGGFDTSHLATKVGQEKLYAIRSIADQGDSNIKYVGEAVPGSLTSAPVWRIQKVDTTSGTIVTWADGDTEFDNVYDDREGLVYA